MRKEDFVSTFVMTTVSILMLVGVTIAWYTAVYAHPTVTNMQMEAEEIGSIKIALKPGGEDIAVLKENEIEGDEYVSIGLEDLLNIANQQMAPGAYGEVVFYITSLSKGIQKCRLTPSLVPEFEEITAGDGTGQEDTKPDDVSEEEKAEIHAILETHFDFYTDAEMTLPIGETTPMEVPLEWDETKNEGIEKKVTIYWKWHYEYPFTQEELGKVDGIEGLTETQKEAKILQYDMEDTKIGTHLRTMRFHFDFSAQ